MTKPPRAPGRESTSVKKATAPTTTITKDMYVRDIVSLLPNAEPLLAEYGLHCFHCSANAYETLEEGCRSHGFEDANIGDLVSDLNTLLQEAPVRPQTLAITLDAARALQGVAKGEGRSGQALVVTLDERGGFCLEFSETTGDNDFTFTHREVPELRVVASAMTLRRIGGASVDFRDGRFKLDLPEDKSPCACGEKCDCKK